MSWLFAADNRRRVAFAICVTAGAYALAPANGWVWDDVPCIVLGRLMGTLHNLPAFFLHDTMWNSSGDAYGASAALDTYRPLTMTTFLVERALWGLRPWLFHIDSVLVHLACVVLVFALGRRLGLAGRAAAAGAAFFGVHPAICEGVHWINGRSDPLCLFFFLATTIVTLDGMRAETFGTGRMALAALLALLASLCKETVYLLAPPLLVLAWGLRLRRGALAVAAVPWVLGLGTGSILRVLVLGGAKVGLGVDHVAYAAMRMPAIWLDGFSSLALPEFVLVPSLYQRYRAVSVPQLVAAWVLVAGGVVGAVLRLRRGRVLEAWALATFLAVMAPVGMLTFREGWPGWGRYLYEASPMFCLAVAGLVLGEAKPGLGPRIRRLLMPAFGVLLAVCALQTLAAARTWKDDVAFYRAQIAADPDWPGAWFGLGLAELHANRPDRAIPPLLRCTEISPRGFDCWGALAHAYLENGSGVAAWNAALTALEGNPRNGMARAVKAHALFRMGRQEESAVLLLDILTDEPEQVGLWRSLRDYALAVGPDAPFTRTARAQAALPEHRSIAARIQAALPTPSAAVDLPHSF